MKDGKIVPVEITVRLLLNAMSQSPRSHFLIDGFPRNEDNLAGWERVVGPDAHVLGCIYFDSSDSVMRSRLVQRSLTSGRSDDDIKVIEKRIIGHHACTVPIVEAFKSRKKCFSVRSDRPVNAVFSDVSEIMTKQFNLTPRTFNHSSKSSFFSRPYSTKGIAAGSLGMALLVFLGIRAARRDV